MRLCCLVNGECHCKAECHNRDTCVFFYCSDCADEYHLTNQILIRKIEKYGAGVLSRESLELAVRRLKRS